MSESNHDTNYAMLYDFIRGRSFDTKRRKRMPKIELMDREFACHESGDDKMMVRGPDSDGDTMIEFDTAEGGGTLTFDRARVTSLRDFLNKILGEA